MLDIWRHCHGDDQIRPVAGTLFRLIENQEQVATLSYVDSLAEQSVLEDLLERSKPPYPNTTDPCTLYTLFTTCLKPHFVTRLYLGVHDLDNVIRR